MRFLVDFSYSGDKFHGYQKQPLKRTVQEEVERVLTNINGGKKVIIHASGRTDAKVNALHQKAHFDIDKKITPFKLKSALNSYLPNDIHVNEVSEVSCDFHARYMVKYKIYEYKINTREYNPLLRTHVYQYCKALNVENMKKAIKYFIGIHDFTTFTSGECDKEDKVRKITSATVKEAGGIVTITFKGKGFLKYQVRNMVGALIRIGEKKVEPSIIPALLEKKDRKAAYLCAPPEGLTLVDVKY